LLPLSSRNVLPDVLKWLSIEATDSATDSVSHLMSRNAMVVGKKQVKPIKQNQVDDSLVSSAIFFFNEMKEVESLTAQTQWNGNTVYNDY